MNIAILVGTAVFRFARARGETETAIRRLDIRSDLHAADSGGIEVSGMNKRLVVMDPGKRLSADLLLGLSRVYDVLPGLSEGDRQDLLPSSPWHGVVISIDPLSLSALASARRVKQLHPSIPVILVGPLPADVSSHEAFEAGVDALVNPGCHADLYAAIATRRPPPSDAPVGPVWTTSAEAPGVA